MHKRTCQLQALVIVVVFSIFSGGCSIFARASRAGHRSTDGDQTAETESSEEIEEDGDRRGGSEFLDAIIHLFRGIREVREDDAEDETHEKARPRDSSHRPTPSEAAKSRWETRVRRAGVDAIAHEEGLLPYGAFDREVTERSTTKNGVTVEINLDVSRPSPSTATPNDDLVVDAIPITSNTVGEAGVRGAHTAEEAAGP